MLHPNPIQRISIKKLGDKILRDTKIENFINDDSLSPQNHRPNRKEEEPEYTPKKSSLDNEDEGREIALDFCKDILFERNKYKFLVDLAKKTSDLKT